MSDFSDEENGDGIFVSSDGLIWHSVAALPDGDQTVTFNIDAVVVGNPGLNYTSDFRIKFEQHDNYAKPTDGRGFDNILLAFETAETIVENFDNGLPNQDQGWRFVSSFGTIEVVNGRLEMRGGEGAHLNEAIWSLDLSGRTDVSLTVDLFDFDDEETSLPTPSYLVGANGDGISVNSDGGLTWYTVASFPNGDGTETYDIGAVVNTTPGLDFNSDFRIKFQQHGNHGNPGYGRGFDNIVLTTNTIPTTAMIENFDDGFPAQGWESISSSPGYIDVVDGSLKMGGVSSNGLVYIGENYLNEVIWTVDLAGQTDVNLSFDIRYMGDQAVSLPTPSFQGSVSGDGFQSAVMV